jgi:predicted lipoprotein with Yx(FWY)xxD motif
MFLKRTIFTALLPLLVIGMLIAACGNSGSTTTGSAAPTATSAPTPTPTTAPAATVMTASATVGGKSVTILTDAKGMTLYYFKKDTATTSACTGGCAQFWPPLLFSGSGTPSAGSATLPGTLSVVTTANGAQVAYQGHLLYTFQKDTAAGQTNGQGFNGLWFVATTDLAPMSGSGGGATTPTATTNGY